MVMMVMMVIEGGASVAIIVGMIAVVGVAIAIAIIVGVVAASIVGVAIARNVWVSSVVWVTTEVRVAWNATLV